jgi:hypothetical protein
LFLRNLQRDSLGILLTSAKESGNMFWINQWMVCTVTSGDRQSSGSPRAVFGRYQSEDNTVKREKMIV